MNQPASRLARAFERFDQINAGDPRTEVVSGVSEPKELVYARRMSEQLDRFDTLWPICRYARTVPWPPDIHECHGVGEVFLTGHLSSNRPWDWWGPRRDSRGGV